MQLLRESLPIASDAAAARDEHHLRDARAHEERGRPQPEPTVVTSRTSRPAEAASDPLTPRRCNVYVHQPATADKLTDGGWRENQYAVHWWVQKSVHWLVQKSVHWVILVQWLVPKSVHSNIDMEILSCRDNYLNLLL